MEREWCIIISKRQNQKLKSITMKLTKAIYTGAIIVALTGITLSSCKKDKLEKGRNDSTAMANFTADEYAVEEATNQSMEDVEGFLGGQGGNGNLKSGNHLPPCNVTIDSTDVINDTITIYLTYDGTSCNGKLLRTGQVEIRKRVGTHFIMEGASVNIRHKNFTITRLATGRSMTINSNKTFTNVTGGNIHMLGHNGFTTLVHRLEGSMNVSFDNGTSRTWQVARQRTYTGTRNNLVLTVDGFGTSGDYTNLVTWGTNRNGEQFYTQITESVVFKQSCEWNPVSGSKFHQIPSADISALVIFGYIGTEPITGDECPTHYRIDWQNGTYSGTRFVPLP